MKILEQLHRAEVRGWLYRVLGAVGLLAGVYGLANGEEVAAWLGLAATVLGTGTAAANTPTRRTRRRPRRSRP